MTIDNLQAIEDGYYNLLKLELSGTATPAFSEALRDLALQVFQYPERTVQTLPSGATGIEIYKASKCRLACRFTPLPTPKGAYAEHIIYSSH